MEIGHTRALLSAALEGALDGVSCSRDNPFGLAVPKHCPGVPDTVLDARGTWADKNAYDEQARDLVGRFHANFTQFAREVDKGVQAAAPMAALTRAVLSLFTRSTTLAIGCVRRPHGRCRYRQDG